MTETQTIDIADRVVELKRIRASDLTPHPLNAREHGDNQRNAFRELLSSIGFAGVLLVYQSDRYGGWTIVDGHLRTEEMPDDYELPCVVLDVDDTEAEIILATHDPLGAMAKTDATKLGFLLESLGDRKQGLDTLLSDLRKRTGLPAMIGVNGDPAAIARLTLAERFVVPPFTVLDARQGYWQDRKRSWIALGIQSEIGRGDQPGTSAGSESPTYREIKHEKRITPGGGGGPNSKYFKTERGDGAGRRLTHVAGDRPVDELDEVSLKILETGSGTSIFDPVLCELSYRWYCPPGGRVFDPFAGGSVRGIVAAHLGRRYVGVDLSAGQLAANVEQAKRIVPDNVPEWICGDAGDNAPSEPVDFLFSCPPYFNLERYSDDPRDLSNMPWEGFLSAYRSIIAAAVGRLNDNRFASFVVGDIRDAGGNYRNFVSETIRAFIDAGCQLYNEAILVTAVGSLPIRVGRQFDKSRKLGKTHQNVLVFIKGDASRATEEIGDVECGDIESAEG